MDKECKVTISEVYDQSSVAWISMKVEIPGNIPQFIEFDNVAQVQDCVDKMLRYLAAREHSPLDGGMAADPEQDYGNV